MEVSSLGIIEREKGDMPYPGPVEKAFHHGCKRGLHAFSLHAATHAVKRMQNKAGPTLLGRQGEAAPDGFRGGFAREEQILPHDRGVHDRGERQGPGFGLDHLPQCDRTLPDGGEFHLTSRRLLDAQGRTGRHPEVVVRREEERIRFRQASRCLLDLNPRLDKVK